MKKGDKQKQKKAEQRRKEKRSSQKSASLARVLANPHYYLHHAREYPIVGCWINEGWQEHSLATVVVARQQPNDNIAFGCFLTDIFCLGVKDVIYNADIPISTFYREYLPKLVHGELEPISPALAHEIVYGAIEYAAQFGFRPHSDFRVGQTILDPPDAHPRSGIEFGKDGKPFYVSGPYDNAAAIIRQLEKKCGAGNYNFLAGSEELF